MSYTRMMAGSRNRFVQGCGTLMGMATGLIADRELNDAEIRFLKRWLTENEDICAVWPGDVLLARVHEVLADGVITEPERAYLVGTLERIVGGEIEDISRGAVNKLALEEKAVIVFPGRSFCVTGDFVYGVRDRVHEAIVSRGGEVKKSVTKNLHFLVVGLRGSPEWKNGSYGTKVEKAMQLRGKGLPLVVVGEDVWAAALSN